MSVISLDTLTEKTIGSLLLIAPGPMIFALLLTFLQFEIEDCIVVVVQDRHSSSLIRSQMALRFMYVPVRNLSAHLAVRSCFFI